MFLNIRRVMFAGFTFVCLSASNLSAQTLDNVYQDWSVFTIDQNNEKSCYAASTPKNKTGNYTKRDEPYLLVTHIAKNVDEVSVSSGYLYKKSSEVVIEIGKGKHQLFTKDNLAWAPDTESDTRLVSSMKAGDSMKVKGTSSKGTYSLDTYSLKGFTAAYNRMKQLCSK